ncbi:MAG: aminotransferase class I/II-fold pyridoxal phosphate-dependent enzyme, partial [Chitinivibrionales bacterium]|nr:aminotransferase class I/II-fold pyridoxal phosphate-dependent enzyme [Chitinivibrionales bacterium]
MTAFSSSARNMRSSEIRRLMKLAADPSVISFAGGMPNNDLFPVEAIDELYAGLPLAAKQAGFQYGPTSGFPPLLEALREYLGGRGLPLEGNGLIVTTGAQQALNLLAKVFIDPGDRIITEYPSFIGALAAFKSYGAELHGVPMDAEGILLDKLNDALDSYAGEHLKMLYLCPCFHNPAGTVYTLERKKKLLEALKGRDIVLIEDDPYSELYFDEADKPLTQPMKAMGEEPVPIAYVGSFAKILGPGMRLGWLLAPEEIVEKVELAKQSMDA